jgi:hypothetical protein
MDIAVAAAAVVVVVVVVVVVTAAAIAVVMLVISISSNINISTNGVTEEKQKEIFSVRYHSIFMASLVMTRKIPGRSVDHLIKFKAGKIILKVK